MLVEAIFGIIAIAVVFCCCTLCCYILSHFLFTEGKGDDEKPEPEPWEATHYYDPLPLSTPSPPDTIFKPTPYTFKLQNGNGVYSTTVPHAVINPAVLQYPPGHVLDQQRVPPPPAQMKIFSTREIRRRSRSRSPSPNVRRSKNVWSTNVDLQQPSYNDFKHHTQNQQQPHSQPAHQHHHQHQYIRYPPEFQQLQEQYQYYSSQDKQQQSQRRQSRQSEEFRDEQPRRNSRPFVVTTHPTNQAYSNHHQHRYKSRLKEEIT